MQLYLPERIKPFYWTVFPVIWVVLSYYAIFHDWNLPLSGFSELEDFGTLAFVLFISFAESAIITVILWWLVEFGKRIIQTPKNELE